MPARSRMKKYLHAENMVIALYCISCYQRTLKEAPTREQLFEFSDWEAFFTSPQNLVELIRLNLEIETTWEKIKQILSRNSKRCILFAYFDFIDGDIDSWLLHCFPHLINYGGGEFKCTLTKYVDRGDLHNLDLFTHLDHRNKLLLMEEIKGRWVK